MAYEVSSLLSSRLPLKTHIRIALLGIFVKAVCRRDGTLNRRLASLFELNTAPNQNPVHGVRTADFTVDPARQLRFRLYLPTDPSPAPLAVIVFFHGGGFAFLTAATREYEFACRRICKELGVAVISVTYRLSPEHKCPAQYEDGVDVLRFLESTKANSSDCTGLLRELFLSADLSRCFLAGESAGGNIAHHVARRWAEKASHHVRLAGLVLIQPFFGGEERVLSEKRLPYGPFITTERTDWMWRAFLPIGASRDHPAANPGAAAENLGHNFPPVLIIAGELDPLLDWQRKYHQSLIRNGNQAELIEYPGAIHGFFLFPELDGGPEMIDEMKAFVLRPRDKPMNGRDRDGEKSYPDWFGAELDDES